VNVINPGPVRTMMRAKAMPGEDPSTLPRPEEIASLIVELLSPANDRQGELVTFKRES
jgi:NAD(P)-dependent dehydrogenase (short-subunit alcohol dehydrogenase family)